MSRKLESNYSGTTLDEFGRPCCQCGLDMRFIEIKNDRNQRKGEYLWICQKQPRESQCGSKILMAEASGIWSKIPQKAPQAPPTPRTPSRPAPGDIRSYAANTLSVYRSNPALDAEASPVRIPLSGDTAPSTRKRHFASDANNGHSESPSFKRSRNIKNKENIGITNDRTNADNIGDFVMDVGQMSITIHNVSRDQVKGSFKPKTDPTEPLSPSDRNCN